MQQNDGVCGECHSYNHRALAAGATPDMVIHAIGAVALVYRMLCSRYNLSLSLRRRQFKQEILIYWNWILGWLRIEACNLI